MLKKNISIPKTARYFQLGEINERTKSIWIVLHGYAQLANYFLENFKVLDTGENVIIAPEGLNRFYWNGFSGKVVASWMTKEDRLDDIADSNTFLDAVNTEINKELKGKKVKINLFGFSQGVATACRWLDAGKINADNLILYCGTIPDDLNAENKILSKQKLYYLAATQDEFFDDKQKKEIQEFLMVNVPDHEYILFDGKHEVKSEVLEMLRRKILL
jgi:predicted esterase